MQNHDKSLSLPERIQKLGQRLGTSPSWEEKYKTIIDLGKALEAYPEEHRLEVNKVKGCQSQVWLHAELRDGRIHFYGDSDASIVKGLVAILLGVYGDATPDEILGTRPTFLEDLGLRQHLSMSRSNGLTAMARQISLFALAFKAKLQSNALS